MSNDAAVLRIISNETKDSINQISVVTPSVFASIFTEFAKKHDTQVENEQDLSTELLTQECTTLTTLQSQTSQNAQDLSSHANKAIEAIKTKDETTLNEVLKETQLLRAEIEKLKESVYKDELTNAYNRKWLNDTYLEKNSDAFKNSGSLAMIDLNYFKIVNDTHGHVIGDKVLIFIANHLKKSNHDVVRYGGDEFMILFSDAITQEEVQEKLDEMRESIIAKKLKARDTLFRTSFSIGVHSFQAGDSLSSTIEIADKNMYEDKVQIKKRVTGIEV